MFSFLTSNNPISLICLIKMFNKKATFSKKFVEMIYLFLKNLFIYLSKIGELWMEFNMDRKINFERKK